VCNTDNLSSGAGWESTQRHIFPRLYRPDGQLLVPTRLSDAGNTHWSRGGHVWGYWAVVYHKKSSCGFSGEAWNVYWI